MLTPAQINSKQFKLVHLRTGYDQEEVDDFLDQVHEDYLHLHQQIRNTPPQGTPQPPQSAVTLAGAERLLVAAEAAAEQAKEEAGLQASEIVTNAHEEASTIIANARKQAEALITEATADKHRAIGELEEQRGHLKEKVDELIRVEQEVTTRMRTALERWNV